MISWHCGRPHCLSIQLHLVHRRSRDMVKLGCTLGQNFKMGMRNIYGCALLSKFYGDCLINSHHFWKLLKDCLVFIKIWVCFCCSLRYVQIFRLLCVEYVRNSESLVSTYWVEIRLFRRFSQMAVAQRVSYSPICWRAASTSFMFYQSARQILIFSMLHFSLQLKVTNIYV